MEIAFEAVDVTFYTAVYVPSQGSPRNETSLRTSDKNMHRGLKMYVTTSPDGLLIKTEKVPDGLFVPCANLKYAYPAKEENLMERLLGKLKATVLNISKKGSDKLGA